MKIKAVLFDFIGTTVLEKDDVINTSFEKAFHDNLIELDAKTLNENRGKDKHEIIDLILSGKKNEKPGLSTKIYNAFKLNIENNLEKFALNEGLNETVAHLKKANLKIGLGSALSRDLFEKIFNSLVWSKKSIDYIGISSEVGRGRPHPDMIFDMMKQMNIHNSEEFLKVGDTTTDILEGKNAEVKTVVILSGTQSETILQKAGPDFMISKLEELVRII